MTARVGNNLGLEGKPLSKREVEILSFIVDGDTNKEIAYKIGISEDTVKNHITSLLQKLKAKNRTHAVVIYCDLLSITRKRNPISRIKKLIRGINKEICEAIR